MARGRRASIGTWWLAVALAAGTLAACGTTVDLSDQQAMKAGRNPAGGPQLGPDDLGGEGTAFDPVTGEALPAGQGGGVAGGPAGTGAGGTGGTAGGAGGPTNVPAGGGTVGGQAGGDDAGGGVAAGDGGQPRAGEVGGTSAQGVTDTTIKIGLAYDKNAGALNTAFGFGGIGQVDQKRAYDLLLDHINANGGVAGRKLEAVYHELDSVAGKTPEQNAQETCATWTQDDKVFAAFDVGTATLNACLNKAGVVQTGTAFGDLTSDDLERFPNLVELGEPAADALGRLVGEDLFARDFYRRGRQPETAVAPYKIGLLAYDKPAFKAAGASLKAVLAEKGLKLSEELYIARAETPNDLGREANDTRAAALRFKERGITHVQFFQTSNAFLSLTFWQSADKLRYFPRYGLTSADGAQALIPTLDAAGDGTAARQLDMAMGTGYAPLRDVPVADYTGAAESPELRRCKEILEPASNGGFDDAARNKEFIAATFCDSAFYFKAAADAGGPVVNTASWARGVATISGLGSAKTFLLRTDRRRDAPGVIRGFAYFPDCGCFHYDTDPKRV